MNTTTQLVDAIKLQTGLDSADFATTMSEVREYGAVHGVTGFIYYNEVEEFLASHLHTLVQYMKATNMHEGNDLYAIAAHGINRHFQWQGEDAVTGSDVYGALFGYDEIDCAEEIKWYLVCTAIEFVAHELGMVEREADWAVEA